LEKLITCLKLFDLQSRSKGNKKAEADYQKDLNAFETQYYLITTKKLVKTSKKMNPRCVRYVRSET
jgi:hypothetical protein